MGISLLPKSCLETLAPNLRRANAILTELGDKSYAGWPDKVSIIPRTQPLIPPNIEADTLEVIYDALFRDHQLKAMYWKKGTDKPVEYTINPLGLVVADPVLYLVGTLWDYEDIKLFAVHRFQAVEMSYEASKKPKGFKLDDYLESGALWFPLPGKRTIKIKALFNKNAAAHLYESPLSHNQKMTNQENGNVMVEAEVLDTHQLRWWLLSFGAYVEVIAPKSLRKEFADIARHMASHYTD